MARSGRPIKNDPIADEICFLIEGDAAFSAEKFPPTQENIEKAKVQIMVS